MNQTGDLVVIEGIDGAGKTTVSRKICEEYDFVHMRQPENTWVGEAARRALNEDVSPACDLFLHLAAHANQQGTIASALETTNVIIDRYYPSRIAYQSVQTQFSAEQIEEFHKDWTIEPSQVIIIDVPVEAALKRKHGSKDKFENVDFLSKVASVYRDYFDEGDDIIYVDGLQPQNEVFNEVKEIIIDR